jgi:hypothetical protein
MQISEQEIIEELMALVRNTWTNEKRPDIQLEALTDFLRLSDDPSKHDMIYDLSAVDALMEIVRGSNPFNEQLSNDDHEVRPVRQGRRGSQDLDYIEKKEIERNKVLQVRISLIACHIINCESDSSMHHSRSAPRRSRRRYGFNRERIMGVCW